MAQQKLKYREQLLFIYNFKFFRRIFRRKNEWLKNVNVHRYTLYLKKLNIIFFCVKHGDYPKRPWVDQKDQLPNERISLILEDPDLLDSAEGLEGLLHQLLGETGGETAAVDRAVGWGALVVYLVEGQGFGVYWKRRKMNEWINLIIIIIIIIIINQYYL